MMDDLVSIVTPNYNCEKFIVETIESVQNQTHSNWELIIIDDASTDSSIHLIKSIIAKDSRIKLIALKANSGPAFCRNKGISIATGKYLTFIDSDDLWKENFIKTALQEIEKSEGFVFASYHRFDESLKPKLKDFSVPRKVSYSDILKTNSISCLTAFIDIKKLGKLYMPVVLYRQDMGLWLQYLKKIEFAIGINEPLAIYRIRKKSHSRNKFILLKHQWNFYRNVEGLTIVQTLYYFSCWIFYGIIKYYF